MSKTNRPFELLASIESESRRLASGLPAQEEAVEHWNGIGFSLAGQQFVAEMGEVVEILHVPRFTVVPGVKGWMQGVANVRGRLLPIMDLSGFFKLPGQSRTLRDRRVLVIDRNEVFSGLIVDFVLGMQYFPVDSFRSDPGDLPDQVKPFVRGHYQRGDQRWHVFNVESLVDDPVFMDVAL